MSTIRRALKLVNRSVRSSAIFSPSSAIRFYSAQPNDESDDSISTVDFDSRDYSSQLSASTSTSNAGPIWDNFYRKKADRILAGGPDLGKINGGEEDERKRKLARVLLEAALMKPDDEEEEEMEVKLEDQKSLSVGIIGAPNAGKSSLTNCMAGKKVAAVSRKTNTTTHEVLGVMTQGDTQICFFDTPGLMLGHRGYPYKNDVKLRVESAWKYIDCYDVIIVLFDVHRHLSAKAPIILLKELKQNGSIVYLSYLTADVAFWLLSSVAIADPLDDVRFKLPDKRVTKLIKLLGEMKQPKQKRILCMNKVDLVEEKKDLLKVAKEFEDLPGYERYFMLSGLKGSGVKDVAKYLMEQAVRRPWEEEQLEAMSEEMMKSISLEVVREKMLHHIHQEIPYVIEHRLMDWKEMRNGSLRVEQHFITHKQSQRQILVGKNGSKIGRIGIEANEELRSIFKREVHLVLLVRVARRRTS